MPLPRDPRRNLNLERLGDRDGSRRAYLGDSAQVRTQGEAASRVGEYSAAYRALIDAVFTAPGAAEWLAGLRRRVAAILAAQDAPRHPAPASDAIRAADPGRGRF
jgi:hypothetical protein